jgi:hypothetical protein
MKFYETAQMRRVYSFHPGIADGGANEGIPGSYLP